MLDHRILHAWEDRVDSLHVIASGKSLGQSWGLLVDLLPNSRTKLILSKLP
jgi:hypothetical protein